jgi:hypothetical protein
MKMVRIFQQCTNCFEKESSLTTVAGLVNRFGKFSLDYPFKQKKVKGVPMLRIRIRDPRRSWNPMLFYPWDTG